MKFYVRHKKLFFVLLIILILSGILGSIAFFQGDNNKKRVSVKKGDIIEGVYGTGTVTANKVFNLRSGVLNTITNVYVKEGDHVKKGSLLIELDKKKSWAPFEGTITYFPYKVGENVFPQSTVLSIIDFTDRYLTVDLEQEAALRVKVGQAVALSFDSIREKKFRGKVESLYSSGQIFLARIGISHLPQAILPGMTADVAIVISVHKDAILVPIVALNGDKVYVQGGLLQKDKAKKIKIGISDDQMVEILEGDIKPGDELVIHKEQGR